MSLREEFLAHLRTGADALAALDDLDTLLAELVDAGRARWPGVEIAPAEFMRYLAERLPPAGDPAESLRAVQAADLYLACGCAAGLPQALAAFDKQYLALLAAYEPRGGAVSIAHDEVKQLVRTRLLVADQGPPKIASYTGQGPLTVWLRMVAARAAVDLQRAQKPQTPLTEAQEMDLQLPAADPELDYLKSRYRPELDAAFRAVLASLDVRDRNILRLHFLEGMTGDAIGAMYNVSGRTVQRWIVASRERILKETRSLLAERLDLSTAQLDSLIGLLQSRIDLSLSQVLKD